MHLERAIPQSRQPRVQDHTTPQLPPRAATHNNNSHRDMGEQTSYPTLRRNRHNPKPTQFTPRHSHTTKREHQAHQPSLKRILDTNNDSSHSHHHKGRQEYRDLTYCTLLPSYATKNHGLRANILH